MSTNRSLLVALIIVTGVVPGCLPTEATPNYCASAQDCKDAARPFCELPAHECVAALPADGGGDLGDQGMDLPSPDLAEPDLLPPPDLMPECVSSSTCPSDKPVCDTTAQTCRACAGDSDDSACVVHDATRPYCLMSSGLCVGCRVDAQCSGSKPICELTVNGSTRNTCRACAKHDECASKLCNADGSCEPSDNIVYVNNRTPDNTAACTGTTHAGTLADPYCQISDGITNRGTKQIVRVLGSSDEYHVISIAAPSTTPLRILGPGSSATTKATVREPTAVTVTINVTGTINVTLAGLLLGSDSTATIERGVDCKGSGVTLTLQDVVVQKAGKEGIASDACALSVTQSTVASNTGAGISVSGGSLSVTQSTVASNTGAGISASAGTVTISQSTIVNNASGINVNTTDYKIENNLIAKNTTGTGVILANTDPTLSTSRCWFNTVTKNGALDTKGGINCASQSSGTRPPIENSIIALNAKTSGASGTQLNGDCSFASVVVGTSEGSSTTGIVKSDPPFVDASTTATDPTALRAAFSLASTDTTVCVDQLDATATFPAVDLFGTARPQGAKFDIGAHEAVK